MEQAWKRRERIDVAEVVVKQQRIILGLDAATLVIPVEALNIRLSTCCLELSSSSMDKEECIFLVGEVEVIMIAGMMVQVDTLEESVQVMKTEEDGLAIVGLIAKPLLSLPDFINLDSIFDR
ncbi:hypothetical protein AgCh_017565 [Apium graveolens]